MDDSSGVARPAGTAPATRFYPRRDMMLGLYGLAMIAVLAGVIVVMVPTILAPGRVRWLIVPAALLLLVGIALALLGQLIMLGKRLVVEFGAGGWTVRPLLGRSTSGTWTDVEAVRREDDERGRLRLQLAGGRALGLDTRWLDVSAEELEAAIRQHLNTAYGYRSMRDAEEPGSV